VLEKDTSKPVCAYCSCYVGQVTNSFLLFEVPGNMHTPSTEGMGNSGVGVVVPRPKYLKKFMKLN